MTEQSPAQAEAYSTAREHLEAEGYSDFDLASASGVRSALSQMRSEAERITTLEQWLRSTLDEADEDALDAVDSA